MSRIFEKPRYINQSRNKLLAIISATNNVKTIKKACSLLHLSEKEMASMDINYQMLSELYMESIFSDESLPGYDVQLEQYLLESEITARVHKSKMLSQPVASRTCNDLIATMLHYNPEKVIHDSGALFFLLKKMLNENDEVQESKESKVSRQAATNLIFYQLMPQKIAPGMWKDIYSKSELSKPPTSRCIRADNWVTATEKGIYYSHTMWVKYCRIWAMNWQKLRPHAKIMVDKVSKSAPHERFKIDLWDCAFKGSNSYNYNGIIVTFVDKVCLIMDNSLLDNARSVFTAIRNSEISFKNFRMTGDTHEYDIYKNYSQVLNWIKRTISDEDQTSNEYIARHMHLTYTAWQNSTCEDKSRFDCGYLERHCKLSEDIMAVYPYTMDLYNMVTAMNICERAKCELLKLYHILPPPDIDPKLLHEELVNKSKNTNNFSKRELETFINFCKSYDFCRLVSKTRELPSYKSVPDYDFLNSSWYTRSLSGKFKMPPEDDWGKVWINKHFPYEHSSDFHVFDAKDVTRVVANLDYYIKRTREDNSDRTKSNELLSALFNGPLLSNGMSMSDWRNKVFEGKLSPDDECIAIEAGKAENTKPGKKVRETLSGSDNVREFLTEVDHAIRPLAQITPGVSIRMDAIKHKRKFQSMAHSISHYSSKLGFATSTDISGWSPKMPRFVFHAWQDYALGTTMCPEPTAVRTIWDRMITVVDRRGYKDFAAFEDGTFQGWPATSDTTMHAHILIYWAYKLREKKILSEREAAYTLCLIDDGATVVTMEGDQTKATERAKTARIMLKDLYALLGFEMDEVKSFFSSVKFVYLNELYIDGAQVMHSTKTFMRMAKDNRRRFAGLTDHIGTIFGMAASSASQGTCPFVSYWMAAWLSYRLVYKTYDKIFKLDSFSLFLVSIASTGFNGLGMKLITSVLSTGQNDQLTWFLEVFLQYLDYGIDNMIEAILNQAPKPSSPIGIFKNPFGYEIADHGNATNLIMSKFRECARNRGLAEPFKTLEKFDYDKEYEEAVKYVLTNGTYDASVLSEVADAMPEAFIDEMMARIERTELIVCMLDSRSIGALRRHVRNIDVRNLQSIYAAAGRRKFLELTETKKLKELGSFLYAKDLRNKRFAGYQVLNHTYPCPFALWAFNGMIDLESEAAQRVTTLSFNKNLLSTTYGSSSVNLYDSVPFEIGYKGYRSMHSSVASEEKVLLYNPVRKKIAKGLSILRWARENGSSYYHLADLFSWSWAGFCDFRLLDLPGALSDVSIKRLSIRHNKANHIISMYPNSQSCVRVNARAITRAQANTHHLFDVMAAITTLRTAGLLEASLAMRMGKTSFAYSFLYKASSSAIVETPLEKEVDSYNPHLEKIPPFVSINCTFSKDARVVCSFKTMTEVLRIATQISDTAAVEYFEDAKENFELDFDDWNEQVVVAEKVRIIHTAKTYDDLTRRTTLILSQSKEKSLPHPIVRDDRRKRNLNEGLMEQTASLSEIESIKFFAQQITDTTAVSLCSEKARLANQVHYAWKRDTLDEFINSGGYEAVSVMFTLSLDSVLSANSKLEQLAPSMKQHDRCSEFMYQMGYRGCRMSKDCKEIVPTMHSYMGTAAGHMQRLAAIAQSIDKFQPRGDESYSVRKLMGDRVAQYNIGDIFRATWRLAAARYEAQADDRAKRQICASEVVKLNHKATFMKAFAKSISSTGVINYDSVYFLIYSHVVESLTRHMGRDDKRKAFTDLLTENHLINIEAIDDEDDLWDILKGIYEVASNLVDDIDISVLRAVYDEVKQWVKDDSSGVVERTTVVSKYRTTKITRETKKQEVVVQPSPTIAPPVAPQVPDYKSQILFDYESHAPKIPGAEEDEFGFDLSELKYAAPHDVMQWVSESRDIISSLVAKGYPDNVYLLYNQITSKKKEWDKFMGFLVMRTEARSFMTPEFSKFEARYMEDLEGSDNWMAE